MKISSLRSSRLLIGSVFLLISSPSVFSQYLWLGQVTGETDLGRRFTVYNGDAVSLFMEANWENTANPGTAAPADSINTSGQPIAGINAPILITNGGVAGGTNGAGSSTGHLRTNGHAVTVSGAGSGLKMSVDPGLRAMIQNDGSPGGDRSPLVIAGGAFVVAERLQDIAVTIEGAGSRLFIASNSADHAGLENSTVALTGLDEDSPEIHFTSNSLENVLPALASITINGEPVSYGSDPFRLEAGDNVLLTPRDDYNFANFKQLDAQGNVSPSGISLRAVTPVAPSYWDVTGATAGGGVFDDFFGGVADGDWDLTSPNWSGDIAGATATAPWTDGGIASFAAGDDVDFGLVTVDGTRTLAGLLVERGVIEIEGGTLQFAGGGIHLGNLARLKLSSQLAGAPWLRIEKGSTFELEGTITTSGLTGDGNFQFFEGDSLTIDSAVTRRFAGSIGGGGHLAKDGAGDLRFARPQILSGELTINAGAVTLAKEQGNIGTLVHAAVVRVRQGATWNVAAAPVTIGADQILTGDGTVVAADRVTWSQPGGNNHAAQVPILTDAVTISGRIEPGDDGIGELAISSGTVTLGATSVLEIEIDDDATPANDKLVVGGLLKIVNGAQIEFKHSAPPTAEVYVLASYGGAAPVTPLVSTTLPDGYVLDQAYQGNSIALVVQAASGFETWAVANGIADADFDADAGNTGVANGVAYALGLDPLDPAAVAALPGLIPANPGEWQWVLPKGDLASADPAIGYFFEVSDDLQDWTKVSPTSEDAGSFRYVLPVTGEPSFLRARIDRVL